ncbi:hypothetical protein GCM10022255_006100 [Dactylosporangium darangshiense]|uniref:Lipoprotein n=1 Tax=Dactylosporangium darangshiense TaxID=579108 RepID=A0ABP8CXA3_9ACTN
MRTAATVLAIVGLGCLLSACRHPGDSAAPVPAPSRLSQEPLFPAATPTFDTQPTREPSRSASASPSPPGFSDQYVTYCNGRPSGEQVIAAVRLTRSNLPAGSGVSVLKAPVCAGVWQYTVLSVTGSEPLRVITKGSPTSLTVVTAGTDPCTAEVRVTAPPAFLATVDC